MKTCPKCNSSCEDSDVICKNCGYMFTPEGYAPLSEAQNEPQHGPQQNAYNAQNGFDAEKNLREDPYHTFNGGPGGFHPEYGEPRNSGMAVASLVLGIVAVVFDCCYASGILFAIISFIFGIVSMNQIKKSGGTQKGNGMALAGVILSVVAILLGIAVICFIVSNWGTFTDAMRSYMDYIRQNGYGSSAIS